MLRSQRTDAEFTLRRRAAGGLAGGGGREGGLESGGGAGSRGFSLGRGPGAGSLPRRAARAGAVPPQPMGRERRGGARRCASVGRNERVASDRGCRGGPG